MVKPVAKAEINSFLKGIITEASVLNFPADASRDEENFELNVNGSRHRRQGIDFENAYEIHSTGFSAANLLNTAVSSFRWLNAGNDPNEELLVIQFGNRVDLYQVTESSFTSTQYVGQVTLTGVSSNIRFSYASIDGKMVIAAANDTIHIIEWNGSTLSYSTDRLLVRDLWGLPGYDNNDINKRPTALTSTITYNLRNQGWGIPRKDSSGTLGDPIAIFNAGLGAFPANSETVYSGLDYQAVVGGTPYERMFPNLYDDAKGLGVQAAKGYFIIDALKRGTSRATVEADNRTKFPSLTYTVSALNSDTTSGGASLVVEYAGRVFYSGFRGEVTNPETNSPNLTNYVLFSQVVKNKNDLVKCYQSGDPTSKEGSDLVDTDGGFLRVAGAKKILAMRVLANNLFVIADNGIWRVSGGGDYGFTATNYKVDKVSSFGGISESTVVEVNDQLYFWGEEGIYLIKRNEFGDWTCNSITLTTIQSLYDDIPYADKGTAVGIYDKGGKKVRWLYGISNDVESTTDVYELIIDLTLGAFSKNRVYSLAEASPRVVGYVLVPSTSSSSEVLDVVVGANDVNVSTSDVTAKYVTGLTHLTSIKFITLHSTVGSYVGYTFSHYRNSEFLDWKTANGVGVDAKAYILTGASTAGDSSIFKQAPYLVMHFLRTEEGVYNNGSELVPSGESSCKVRSQWNWANTINSGNWGTMFQAYRYRKPLFISTPGDAYDNGFETVVSKNKLRGRGRAIALYMETEPNKNCIILGWNLSVTGNSLA